MFENILVAVDGSEELTGRCWRRPRSWPSSRRRRSVSCTSGRAISSVGRASCPARADEAGVQTPRSVHRRPRGRRGEGDGGGAGSLASLVAPEILAEAEESGASLIIMGSRGLSDLKGLLVGSTTHKVLHLGRLPVLIVR